MAKYRIDLFRLDPAGGLSDNGPGLTDHNAASNGVGLSNTRARLQTLYGKALRRLVIKTAGRVFFKLQEAVGSSL